ncbi:pyridoxamine 5'-phosphate oxidase family protein [Candidatus Binatia bacterium]|nr:pyridoxamine 5'-phosphate oxidase family protein [Candidatus Binatia bacterium]
MATVGDGGVPNNVPVCPVALNGRLYFASPAAARKVRDLRSNPRVALVFDVYADNWKRRTGVMIRGSASIIDQGAAFRRVRLALYRKYKPYRRLAPITEGRSVVVCITPTSSLSWGL